MRLEIAVLAASDLYDHVVIAFGAVFADELLQPAPALVPVDVAELAVDAAGRTDMPLVEGQRRRRDRRHEADRTVGDGQDRLQRCDGPPSLSPPPPPGKALTSDGGTGLAQQRA